MAVFGSIKCQRWDFNINIERIQVEYLKIPNFTSEGPLLNDVYGYRSK